MEALNKSILDFSVLVTGKRGFPANDKIDGLQSMILTLRPCTGGTVE